jgi:hypothetical protein
MTKKSVGTVTKKIPNTEEKNSKKSSTSETEKKSKDTKEKQVDHCGISTCTDDIWNTSLGGDDTCGSKVGFFKSEAGGGMSETDACSVVAHNYSDQCGKCYPDKDKVKGYIALGGRWLDHAEEFTDKNGVSKFDSIDQCIERVKDSQSDEANSDIVAVIYRNENHGQPEYQKTCVVMKGDGWNNRNLEGLGNHETACLDESKFIKNGCK